MDIRFADHPSFQRAAAGMVGSALLFGAALQPLTGLAPILGGALGIAAGATFAYGRPVPRIALGVTAAALLYALLPASWPALTAVAVVLALVLAVGGPRGLRGLAGVVGGAFAMVVAMWCAYRISHAHETAHWPALATAAVSAAAMAIVGVMAALPRHLELAVDPVAAALRQLPTGLDAEVRGLCTRAVAIWTTAKDRSSLSGDETARRLIRDGVVKTLEVAARSAEVKVVGPSDAELAERMSDLDQRIAAATDSEVKTQYQSARAALDDQQRYRSNIRQGRERLVARMHNHIAALEKFELAAAGLEAARVTSLGSSVVNQLEALSQDVTASGDALAELELGERSA